ncbi:MAG: DUF4230 domain-containing protein [Bacteroidaceae bacterium]|nr:DUF4230 domain-containing protein [Bacteroidaceae bacterium]
MGKIFSFFLKSLMSKIVGLLLIVGLFVGAWLYTQQFGFNFFNLNFGRGDLKIDNTANIVEKVKEISEFTTACYYEEAVLKDKKTDNNEGNLLGLVGMETSKEIVILSKGKVRAGFDLSKINAENINISGDTLSIELPQPQIFDIITNPSDYEMYVEDGKWSHDEISALQTEYRNQLQEKAKETGILTKAKEAGKKRLESLFMTFGFSVVKVKCE